MRQGMPLRPPRFRQTFASPTLSVESPFSATKVLAEEIADVTRAYREFGHPIRHDFLSLTPQRAAAGGLHINTNHFDLQQGIAPSAAAREQSGDKLRTPSPRPLVETVDARIGQSAQAIT